MTRRLHLFVHFLRAEKALLFEYNFARVPSHRCLSVLVACSGAPHLQEGLLLHAAVVEKSFLTAS